MDKLLYAVTTVVALMALLVSTTPAMSTFRRVVF